MQIKGNYDKVLTGPKSQKQLQNFINMLIQLGSYEQVTRARALILQGGGSLGAHDAGVYQALYERITKKVKD